MRIERLPGDAKAADLVAALEREGCAIVEDALRPATLAALNAELDPLVAAKGAGGHFADVHDGIAEFYGRETVRFDGLPARSRTFSELLCQPLLLAAADHYLLPSCERYTLSTGQLIEIGPGETPQALHRDEDAWFHFPRPRPHLQVEAIFALYDFTAANGATRVVPGSHHWDPMREAEPREEVAAEMPAGSMLVFLGKTLHGGGANTTLTSRRRACFVGFCLGWLRAEENLFLSVTPEIARTLPRRAQELVGYKSHGFIGVADVSDPIERLSGLRAAACLSFPRRGSRGRQPG